MGVDADVWLPVATLLLGVVVGAVVGEIRSSRHRDADREDRERNEGRAVVAELLVAGGVIVRRLDPSPVAEQLGWTREDFEDRHQHLSGAWDAYEDA
ncbi:MAG: hypothetical protein AAGF91_02890 [Actinomycetota bacterium]